MTDQPIPTPLDMDLRNLFLAGEIIVSTAVLPPEAKGIIGYAGPALMFVGPCRDGCGAVRSLVLPRELIREDQRDQFVDAIRTALDTLFDDELMARHGKAAHDANVSLGRVPGESLEVRCPGCNGRLYGVVAVRGGCLACYPDLGPLEQAAELGEEADR